MNLPRIIGIILVTVSLGLLASGAYKLYLATSMLGSGVSAAGKVAKLWKKRGGPGRRDEYLAAVAFTDESGEQRQAELRLGETYFRKLKLGDHIAVRYLAGHPDTADHAETATAALFRAALIPLVGGGAFLVIAVFLFLRRGPDDSSE